MNKLIHSILITIIIQQAIANSLNDTINEKSIETKSGKYLDQCFII